MASEENFLLLTQTTKNYITNKKVFRIVQETKSLLKTMQNRRGKVFGYLIRYESFLRSITEEEIETNKGRERSRRNF